MNYKKYPRQAAQQVGYNRDLTMERTQYYE